MWLFAFGLNNGCLINDKVVMCVKDIGGGAHGPGRAAAGQQDGVCRLRPVRQRHARGPQHRSGAQLLHVGSRE